MSVVDRFMSKVDRSGECWIWTASTTDDGYGQFFVSDRRWRSHRWSYIHYVGAIPEGLELDHLCRVRRCCNPAHLEPVTRRENQKRGNGPTSQNIDATHCKHGHEFTLDSTYWSSEGKRQCRPCNTRRTRERRQYRRDEA